MNPTTNPPAEHPSPVRYDVSLLTPEDFYLFNEGSHYRIYDKLGAHLVESHGTAGAVFSLWAPNARRVSCYRQLQRLEPHFPSARSLAAPPESGKASSPASPRAQLYKFHIDSTQHGYRADKADPVAHPRRKAAPHRLGRLGSRLHLE